MNNDVKNTGEVAPQDVTEQNADVVTSATDANGGGVETAQTPIDALPEATNDDGSAGTEETTAEVLPEDNQKDVANDVTIDGLEQLEDGSYRFVVDPENPEGTVYTGKSIDEVLSNMRNGVREKDRFIAEQKQRLEATSEKPFVDEEISFSELPVPEFADVSAKTPPINIPPFEDVLQEQAKKYGREDFTPEMLNWGRSDWDSFEKDNGKRTAQYYESMVRTIVDVSTKVHNNSLANFVNKDIIHQETLRIKNLIKDAGLEKSFTKKQYDTILNNVIGNKNNYHDDGYLLSGALVAESMKEVIKLLKQKQGAVASGTLKSVVAKANQIIGKVPPKTLSNSKTIFKTPTRPPFGSWDEATEGAKNFYRESKAELY